MVLSVSKEMSVLWEGTELGTLIAAGERHKHIGSTDSLASAALRCAGSVRDNWRRSSQSSELQRQHTIFYTTPIQTS